MVCRFFKCLEYEILGPFWGLFSTLEKIDKNKFVTIWKKFNVRPSRQKGEKSTDEKVWNCENERSEDTNQNFRPRFFEITWEQKKVQIFFKSFICRIEILPNLYKKLAFARGGQTPPLLSQIPQRQIAVRDWRAHINHCAYGTIAAIRPEMLGPTLKWRKIDETFHWEWTRNGRIEMDLRDLRVGEKSTKNQILSHKVPGRLRKKNSRIRQIIVC